jgi:Leucine-rich repeat (LRR) protein
MNLEFLIIESNNISSVIPTEIGQAIRLRELRLANNTLTGTIPLTIGDLINLGKFDRIIFLASLSYIYAQI